MFGHSKHVMYARELVGQSMSCVCAGLSQLYPSAMLQREVRTSCDEIVPTSCNDIVPTRYWTGRVLLSMQTRTTWGRRLLSTSYAPRFLHNSMYASRFGAMNIETVHFTWQEQKVLHDLLSKNGFSRVNARSYFTSSAPEGGFGLVFPIGRRHALSDPRPNETVAGFYTSQFTTKSTKRAFF